MPDRDRDTDHLETKAPRTAVRFLGIEVTPRTDAEFLDLLSRPTARPVIVLNHNLHSAYFYRTLTWFRELYDNAHLILIDGWPVLRLASFTPQGGRLFRYRIGSTDWLSKLLSHSEIVPPGFRIFVLGADDESNALAVERFVREAPDLEVEGHRGFFDLDRQGPSVVRQLTEFSPNLVLVGMGMPRQEEFLAKYASDLPAAFYVTVGGAIDYVAGRQHLSPRILGHLGAEWLWRLLHDPKRLFTRYCLEPFRLVHVIVREKLVGARSPGPGCANGE